MSITVNVDEVIAVLRNQRNTALDEVALQTARVADLEKEVKELMEKAPKVQEMPS